MAEIDKLQRPGFDDWLDGAGGDYKRGRLESFMGMDDNFHKREMLMGWLIGAWNAGAENGETVDRNEAGMRVDGVPLYQPIKPNKD